MADLLLRSLNLLELFGIGGGFHDPNDGQRAGLLVFDDFVVVSRVVRIPLLKILLELLDEIAFVDAGVGYN